MSAASNPFRVDTLGDEHEQGVRFVGASRRVGHGSRVWLWAPEEAMPEHSQWPAVSDPPVLALLDTEVHEHVKLDDPPFRLDATEVNWPYPAEQVQADEMDFGRFWAHGTFIAGLVRYQAPGAQLLSLPVMNQHGDVDKEKVITALECLVEYRRRENRRLVVLMAFGGEADAGDFADGGYLRRMTAALAALQVPVVASAGNGGSERPHWPAAFATDPGLSVISVGARTSQTERAPFSNYGVWVRRWRPGANLISLIPLGLAGRQSDNYGWWSGTSFAAANYASELMCRMMRGEKPVTSA